MQEASNINDHLYPINEALIDEARLGDRSAFTTLLREHDPAMRALAYRMMGSASAMDDVLQDAYVKAFKSISGFRQESSFSTWLYAIVYRTSLDAIRKRERRRETGLHLVTEQPSTVARAEERITEISSLESALAELSPEQRAVLLLVDANGLTYDEAATALDVNPGTIASRLNRARTAVRSALANQEDDQ